MSEINHQRGLATLLTELFIYQTLQLFEDGLIFMLINDDIHAFLTALADSKNVSQMKKPQVTPIKSYKITGGF